MFRIYPGYQVNSYNCRYGILFFRFHKWTGPERDSKVFEMKLHSSLTSRQEFVSDVEKVCIFST